MEDFRAIEKDLVLEHDMCVVQRGIGFAVVVRSKLDRRLCKKSRLGLGGDRMVMVEADDPKGCSEGLLSGH